MDEGILNELLECSVCLERLDSSSKVLPCQHTFCKRCLEEIVTSRNELRCPECRILVETKICDLPNNFLLIRLLEGIKSNPKINKIEEGNTEISSSNHERQGGQNAGNSDLNKSASEFNLRKSSSETSRKEIVQPHPCARALYTYDAKEPGDLSFKKGDIIMLRKKIDLNWYHGELGNKHGFFPVTYVQIITPLPSHLPQAKALYDFKCHESDEKDCLTFKKGDVITVIRRVDENWIEGKLFEKIGIFPITFVEMNSAARAIIKLSTSTKVGPVREVPPAPQQQQQPVVLSPTPSHIIQTSTNSEITSNTSSNQQSTEISDARTKTQSLSVQSVAALTSTQSSHIHSSSSPDITQVSTSVIPQPLPQPPSHPRHLVHRQLREKRHTVSSSTTTVTPSKHNAASHQSSHHRHSIDASCMLSPINIPSHIARPRACSHPVDEAKETKRQVIEPTSASSTSAISITSDVVSDSGTCLVRRHSTNRREKNAIVHHSRQHSAPDPTSLPSSSGHSSTVQAPLIYVAMYSYKPQKEDELELKKNELYTVSEKCLDGWYKGTSLRTSQTGVFPGNYVQLSKSSAIHQGNLHQMSSHSNVKNSSKASPATSSQLSCESNAQNNEQSRASSTSQRTTLASSTSAKVSTSVKSPPPRPPRPVVTTEPSTTANTSPWVAKSEIKSGLLPQPPKMTVALPPNVPSPSSVMGSSIPVPVQASVHRKAICCTTSSQSWHGAIPSACRSIMSSAMTVTPPNVSVSACSTKTTPSKTDKTPKDKKEKERVTDVFKRLTGVKKKSKSPPPATFSMDNPNFIDVCGVGTSDAHVRSGSCPSDRSTSHKKATVGETAVLPHSTSVTNTPRPKQPAPLVRERFRCIVPYPPNSDYELELKVGDIIYVHKKRDDGWYKGTLQRTGVTGLFPGSFVETF